MNAQSLLRREAAEFNKGLDLTVTRVASMVRVPAGQSQRWADHMKRDGN